MITTVIRIPEEEYKFYKTYALQKDWSMAELFRKSARKMTNIEKNNSSSEKFSLKDLGTKIVCKKKLGLADASVNTDKYLYEFEEKRWKKKS